MQDDIGLMTLWCLSKYRGILRGLSARRSCQLMSRKKANVYLKPFSHTTLRRILHQWHHPEWYEKSGKKDDNDIDCSLSKNSPKRPDWGKLWLPAGLSLFTSMVHSKIMAKPQLPQMGGAMSQGLYLHTSAAASAVSFQASVIKLTLTGDIADGHVAWLQWKERD